jgi:hypothetical protein
MLHIRTGLILIVATAIFLSQSGLIIWSNIKQLSSQYVTEHQKQINSRDTIVLSSAVFHDKHTIQWLQKNEVRYLGNMFDIRLILKSEGQIKLIGHYDRVENKLYNLLSQLLETDKKNGTNNITKYQFEFSDAVLNYILPMQVLYGNIKNSTVFQFINIFYSYHNVDSDIKPPEFFFK